MKAAREVSMFRILVLLFAVIGLGVVLLGVIMTGARGFESLNGSTVRRQIEDRSREVLRHSLQSAGVSCEAVQFTSVPVRRPLSPTDEEWTTSGMIEGMTGVLYGVQLPKVQLPFTCRFVHSQENGSLFLAGVEVAGQSIPVPESMTGRLDGR